MVKVSEWRDLFCGRVKVLFLGDEIIGKWKKVDGKRTSEFQISLHQNSNFIGGIFFYLERIE